MASKPLLKTLQQKSADPIHQVIRWFEEKKEQAKVDRILAAKR